MEVDILAVSALLFAQVAIIAALLYACWPERKPRCIYCVPERSSHKIRIEFSFKSNSNAPDAAIPGDIELLPEDVEETDDEEDDPEDTAYTKSLTKDEFIDIVKSICAMQGQVSADAARDAPVSDKGVKIDHEAVVSCTVNCPCRKVEPAVPTPGVNIDLEKVIKEASRKAASEEKERTK